jgi:hypothetical protein
MKRLKKLQINSEKILQIEELVTLRGGYGGACCWCVDENEIIQGAMAASNESECKQFCSTVSGWHGYWHYHDPQCQF